MEAKSSAVWGSVDAKSEESEMIAHLQSMFWCSSDVDADLCSSNGTCANSFITASTLPGSLFLPLIDTESYGAPPLASTSIDMCFDHCQEIFTPRAKAVTGGKRILHMDEQREENQNPTKRFRTVPLVSRASSGALDDETNTELVGQSCSSCCSSEEDSTPSEKSIVLKQSDLSRPRKQSSKGSQSLYAKKRRERINEKLKILQQLIPNGAKVDISTMLEDAVQYVKFLQLQIKLLSSDETWMYAPLAYNGMNVGPIPLQGKNDHQK